ncbi:hypothetical protein GGX14DRAFT_405876 [Mycena pura]|uniref:Uncharacterized protein n=1 Tax=Mycena pura TaxID=153505 RepID=A0AAD6UR04_9AGAR|nr:hypothetical protein GGX14DRAFT_405876 [Mycena pura]
MDEYQPIIESGHWQKTTQITSYSILGASNKAQARAQLQPKPEAIRAPQPQASGGQALQLSAFNPSAHLPMLRFSLKHLQESLRPGAVVAPRCVSSTWCSARGRSKCRRVGVGRVSRAAAHRAGQGLQGDRDDRVRARHGKVMHAHDGPALPLPPARGGSGSGLEFALQPKRARTEARQQLLHAQSRALVPVARRSDAYAPNPGTGTGPSASAALGAARARAARAARGRRAARGVARGPRGGSGSGLEFALQPKRARTEARQQMLLAQSRTLVPVARARRAVRAPPREHGAQLGAARAARDAPQRARAARGRRAARGVARGPHAGRARGSRTAITPAVAEAVRVGSHAIAIIIWCLNILRMKIIRFLRKYALCADDVAESTSTRHLSPVDTNKKMVWHYDASNRSVKLNQVRIGSRLPPPPERHRAAQCIHAPLPARLSVTRGPLR